MYSTTLLYRHMLQTLDAMSLHGKQQFALIVLQCCLIAIHSNATTCAITQCMAIVKTRATNILCLCSSIMCSKSKK
jgi:hypothetical protein